MPSLCQVKIRSVSVGTATSMVDDSHVLGISLALVHRAQGLESLNPQLLLGEFGSVHQQYTKTEHIMGNANQRIVLTEVRSCTELPFCHVKQHSTSISLLGWRDLHELCNFYKSQCNSSSSSTWVAHHICSTHTLEISEKIQATLPFQLKPAQSKTNVVISGSSELRLQQ